MAWRRWSSSTTWRQSRRPAASPTSRSRDDDLVAARRGHSWTRQWARAGGVTYRNLGVEDSGDPLPAWFFTQGAGLQQGEYTMNSMARRMFELVEPVGVIPYSADEPNEAMFALGFTNYWDTYFAGRAAPLGLAPAEVVDALFYNFAPGEVARHIPKVWRTTTPEAAIAARQTGCANALRRILRERVDAPGFA